MLRKYKYILSALLCLLTTTAAAQQQYTIDVDMLHGTWYQWNGNALNPYASSWFSSDSPHISVCSMDGSAQITDIRNNTIYGANNMGLWNDGNNITFYTYLSGTGKYQIMVADGWSIKSVEFDFNSSTDDGIGVRMADNEEVVSTGPDDTRHVSMSTTSESTYFVNFEVSKKGNASRFARTSNFHVTVVQDQSLAARYSALMSDAKMQLAGALRLSNARSEVDTSRPLIKDVSQLSSPYTESSEGSLEALLDGSPTTFWHSAWSGGSVPNHAHYLQVDLGESLYENIAMTFTRRAGAMNDHVTVWSVYGSSDPNSENWAPLSYLYTPFSSNTETIISLPFNTQGYQYLRFYIDNTTTGRGYGHLSEFQLNPANLVVDPGITFVYKAITLGNIVGQQNLMDINDIALAEYNQLKEANDALREEFIYCFEVDGIHYKLTNIENATVAVSYQGPSYDWYYNEYAGNVAIPETVVYEGKTYNVTSIDERAFYGCPSLTAVTIPASIADIGASAFNVCPGLTSVTVGHSEPLVLHDATFSNRANATLYVPSGAEIAYLSAPYWQDFMQIGEPTYPEGDVNLDGIVTLADKTTLIQWLLTQTTPVPYDEQYDVNGDGTVDVRDALRILELIAAP